MKINPASRNAVLSEKCSKPTDHWTNYQILWVVQQTVVSSAICFAANFGVATLLFYNKSPNPTLWLFPTPMSATYALTIIIEIILNYFLSGSMMTLEVNYGRVSPISTSCIPYWPDESSIYLWYLNTSELVIPLYGDTSYFERTKSTLKRTVPWIIFVFFMLWPLFTLITYATYGNGQIHSTSMMPEYLCASIGFLTAFITIPFWAIITLGSIGTRYTRNNYEPPL